MADLDLELEEGEVVEKEVKGDYWKEHSVSTARKEEPTGLLTKELYSAEALLLLSRFLMQILNLLKHVTLEISFSLCLQESRFPQKTVNPSSFPF